MEKNCFKVLVLMSGGVDSSVAAALLKEQGHLVTGVTMKIWEGDVHLEGGKHHGCYGPEEEEDIEDARRIAESLGIHFRVIDLTREYRSTVLDYFSQEYSCGRTPNPCVRCNQRIKFGTLIEKARDIGLEYDYIASGHYARLEYDKNSEWYHLKKAVDLRKDQSYFLALLSQKQLGKLIFPLGEITKVQVREIASRLGLPVADKPDSQNFISGSYASMIKMPATPGPIFDKKGNLLGQHQGIPFYTIGQRKGLEIAAKEILYVTDLEPERNAVIVGTKDEIYQDECVISNINWIAFEEMDRPIVLKAKIRSSHQEAEAMVIPIDDEKVRLKFSEPQKAITPGQVAVFYDGDKVIGGGTITRD